MFLLRNFSGVFIIGGAASLLLFKPLELGQLQLLLWGILFLLFIWQRHHISNQVLITVSISIIALLFIGCNVWNITRQFIVISLIAIGLLLLGVIYCFDCFMRYPRKYFES